MPDPPPPLEMSDDECRRVTEYLGRDLENRYSDSERLLMEILESSRRIETLLEKISVDLRRGPAGFKSGL